MIIGYTCGVFDLFHVGHLNLLINAKSLCDRLIIGLTTDDAVSYKGTECVIPYEDRYRILMACKYVDIVVPQDKQNHNKLVAHDKIKYDILFVGDDWHNTKKWNMYEEELKKRNVKIIYFPYTAKISTTKLKQRYISIDSEKKI